MRVLLLHNRYRALGGEERAVADLEALLRARGHEVLLLERSSGDVGRVRAGRALLRGGDHPEQVAAAVRKLKADVVHAHNLHPLLGWRALEAARAEGARTILQLHNFRLFCAIAVAFRDGEPCYRCHHTHTLPGLRLRCRGSLPEAAVYAAGLRVQQPRLFEHAERFAVLGRAHGARLAQLGLPAERTRLLPNFIPRARMAASPRAASPAASPRAASPRGVEPTHALVAGRLVEEKGFDTAIAAARKAGVPLVVAGAGPDRRRLSELARGGDVRFTGWLEQHELDGLRASAAAVLVPSRCEEACPYAVLDALADGVPVLVSDRGGLPEMVCADAVLPARDPGAWAAALEELWRDPAIRRERGERALALAQERFGEERHHRRLIDLYAGE